MMARSQFRINAIAESYSFIDVLDTVYCDIVVESKHSPDEERVVGTLVFGFSLNFET
jgi:hypothetical protein